LEHITLVGYIDSRYGVFGCFFFFFSWVLLNADPRKVPWG
jgi:hypothetical protein